MDNINISLATVKGRKSQLEKTVSSLLNQGDKINVFFNGFAKPEIDSNFLTYPVELDYKTSNVNIGDQGKFYWSFDDGYHIICDDDIIYPQDYVETMIAAVDKYDRKAVVTIHGKQFKPGRIKNFYTHCSARPHCRQDLEKDTPVHCPGTGVMAYHSSLFKPKMSDFRSKNMADLWIGRLCQKNKIPCIAIAHKGDWIKVQKVENTIFGTDHRKPQRITNYSNEIKWTLHKM